jgi:hypothetical protein
MVAVFWIMFAGISFAYVEMRWVLIEDEYQAPSLHTVHADADAISLDGNTVVLR